MASPLDTRALASIVTDLNYAPKRRSEPDNHSYAPQASTVSTEHVKLDGGEVDSLGVNRDLHVYVVVGGSGPVG